jgi:aryl carrier-like protein
MDENLAPCPPLVTGEIYIRTPYRTAGYIGNKAENDRVFVKNPHTNDKDDLLYKTGDLGRQDLQGKVQVLGRKDAQIKLNGIRIELSDIKENILQFPEINDAVVTVKEVQGVKTIGTYFRSESQITEIDLIQFLAERLPRTMLPGFFMQVDEFPVTSSGKTDVNALPLPENQVGDQAEPRTEQEATLLEIWQQVLDTKQIGLHDNFFTIGGDSLKAIRIVSFLKKAGYELAIKDLFVYQSIALLAPQLVKTTEEVQITPVAKQEYYPLSSGQRRQYMSHQMRENTLNFNMTISFEVPDTVGKSKVEEILKQLIQRHESLRTTYKNVNGEPVQIIHDRLAIEVEEIAIETFHTPGYNFSVPFELDQAPLIRGGLVLSEGTNLVLIDLHHINSDGLSNNILKEEFIALLTGESLAEQTLQYKDFAVWQNERNTPENMEKMASYWLDVFVEEISRTTWPVHHSETYGHIDRANSIAFELDTDLSQRLKDLTKKQGVSLFTLLLSIQNIVFQKLTSLEDLVVGFPSAGRNRTELENIVGVFINTIALRVYPKNSLSFRDFLSQTAEHFNQALQYQDYPFDELIEQLNLPRNNNFNPLFNTIMVMQNHMDYGSVDIVSNEEGIVLETQGEVAENELFIRCAEVQDRLILKYQYSTGVLLRQDLIQMFGYFKEVTEAILENEQVAIGDIQLSHDLGETHGELLEDAFSF